MPRRRHNRNTGSSPESKKLLLQERRIASRHAFVEESLIREEEEVFAAGMTPQATRPGEAGASHGHFPATEGDVPREIVMHLLSVDSVVRQSYTVPRRVCAALTYPDFFRDLQQSYMVLAQFEPANRIMHFQGKEEDVSACLYYVRTLVDQWQGRLKESRIRGRK